MKTNSRIPALEGFHDRGCTVPGGVVGNDDFHVLPVLPNDRSERLLQKARLAEARNQNTDLRRQGQARYLVPGPIASQSVFLLGHAGPSFISKNRTDSSTLPAVFD
jgi:hypothetical protein